MRPALLLLIGLASPTFLMGQTSPRPTALEAELRPLYQSMLDAIRKRDTALLNRVLADEYIYTNGYTAEVLTKSQRLRQTIGQDFVVDTLTLKSLSLHVYPSLVVASALVRQVNRYSDTVERDDVLATVVFTKAPNGWRIAATHTTVVPGSQNN